MTSEINHGYPVVAKTSRIIIDGFWDDDGAGIKGRTSAIMLASITPFSIIAGSRNKMNSSSEGKDNYRGSRVDSRAQHVRGKCIDLG